VRLNRLLISVLLASTLSACVLGRRAEPTAIPTNTVPPAATAVPTASLPLAVLVLPADMDKV
jgi:hypothetical protein